MQTRLEPYAPKRSVPRSPSPPSATASSPPTWVRIETINEAAQLATGFTAGQALGRQLDDVFRLYEEPASRTASAAAERYTQPGGLQQATYEVLIHRSGERYAIEYTAAATARAAATRRAACWCSAT